MSDLEQHYKITWLSNAFKSSKYRRSIALGVCEYSRKIAFAVASDDVLTQLVVHDLYIVNGECEEGRHCLCKSCPYNKTTTSSLGASAERWRGIKESELENIHRRLAEIEEILIDEINSIDWQEKQIILQFEKTPIVLTRVRKQEIK